MLTEKDRDSETYDFAANRDDFDCFYAVSMKPVVIIIPSRSVFDGPKDDRGEPWFITGITN